MANPYQVLSSTMIINRSTIEFGRLQVKALCRENFTRSFDLVQVKDGKIPARLRGP